MKVTGRHFLISDAQNKARESERGESVDMMEGGRERERLCVRCFTLFRDEMQQMFMATKSEETGGFCRARDKLQRAALSLSLSLSLSLCLSLFLALFLYLSLLAR